MSKTYVIGGIIDRSIKKAVTLDRARELSIAARRLPIQEYIRQRTNHILNVDHVVHAICTYLHTRDWATTFDQTLPTRKKAQGGGGGGGSGDVGRGDQESSIDGNDDDDDDNDEGGGDVADDQDDDEDVDGI
jgi:tRNA (Guanine-1)-methyltransferase